MAGFVVFFRFLGVLTMDLKGLVSGRRSGAVTALSLWSDSCDELG